MGILVSDFDGTVTRYYFSRLSEVLRERGELFHPFQRWSEITDQLQKTPC